MPSSIRASELVALLVASVVLATAPRAHAQDDTAAEVLFREGKELMKQGRYDAACPKLAESQRIDPSTGTLLALALCHEREGKTATAWAELLEVIPLAHRDGRVDRETVAREHAAALERSLSYLVIDVSQQAASARDLKVVRDGNVVGKPLFGVPVPVDPGPHRVEVTAAGKRTFAKDVDVRAGGDRKVVVVGALETATDVAPPAPPPVAVRAPEGSWWSTPRVVAAVLGGAAVVAFGAGTYFGIRAIAKSDDAKSRCDPSACDDPSAFSANDDAKRSATIANVAIGVGAAAAVASAVLFFTSTSSVRSNARPNGAAVVVTF